MKTSILIVAIALTAGFIFRDDIQNFFSKKQEPIAQDKKKKPKKDKTEPEASPGVVINNQWDLPPVLKEISGLAYLDSQRFACVQDEEGVIFIFNTQTKTIEKQIAFAGPGDYEGITVKDKYAYVVRADGRLFEVDLQGTKATAREYATSLTVEHNVEGLCYDAKNDRLLLATKNGDPGVGDYKGVYEFNLKDRKFVEDPVYKIDLKSDPHIQSNNSKNKVLMPSAIAVHPTTREIFVTDGPKSRLAKIDQRGKVQKVWELGKQFAQPEGLTFSPEGELFISNEGAKRAGNIIKLQID